MTTKSEHEAAAVAWFACECDKCESIKMGDLDQCKLYPAYSKAVAAVDLSHIVLKKCSPPIRAFMTTEMMQVTVKFYQAAVAVAHAHEEVMTAMIPPSNHDYDTFAMAVSLLTQKKKTLTKALGELNELVAE